MMLTLYHTHTHTHTHTLVHTNTHSCMHYQTHAHTVHPRPPLVNRTNIFEEDGITVLLEWMEQSGVTHNVTIIPQVPIVWVSGTSVRVRVDYSVNYNVTISATLCGQNSVDNTPMIFFGKSQLLLSILLL